MELHIQKCQHCGSRQVRNYLVRDEEQKVFVQCRDCNKLVARYLLRANGYYHAGKGFESFLRSIEHSADISSSYDISDHFHQIEGTTEDEFNKVLVMAKDKYQDGIP